MRLQVQSYDTSRLCLLDVTERVRVDAHIEVWLNLSAATVLSLLRDTIIMIMNTRNANDATAAWNFSVVVAFEVENCHLPAQKSFLLLRGTA